MPNNSHKPDTFVSLALALANDYSQLFVIDSKNYSYEEYSVSNNNKELVFVSGGDNFFQSVQKSARKLVYIDDQKYFLKMFDRSAIIRNLSGNQSFSFSYRLVVDGAPRYYFLKAIRSGENKIVIGVQDIDEQKRREAITETYSHIAGALASQYEVIYYIDIDTNAYSIYESSEKYAQLGTTTQGSDFFKDSAEDIKTYIYQDDREHML